MRFKACPRCRGDLHTTGDQYGAYEECLQCGYTRDLDVPPEEEKAGEALAGPLASPGEDVA